MRKISLMFALLFTLIITAQDNNYESKTIEFIKLTGATSSFDTAIDQIGIMVAADKKEQYLTEAKGTLDALYPKIAKIYMKQFTESEIDELIAFYKSPIGKKLASNQNAIIQSSMTIGQSWGMELQQIAQKFSN